MKRPPITGSNNITLPVPARVRQRLEELREIGKTHFQKGEDGRWNEIPAEYPVAGPLDWAHCVRKLSDDEYTVTYEVFRTKPDKLGIPRPETIIRKAGERDMGMTEKIIDHVVVETFKKGRPFKQKKEPYVGTPINEAARNPEFREQRQSIITGGHQDPSPGVGDFIPKNNKPEEPGEHPASETNAS